jgi:hypothetical protein
MYFTDLGIDIPPTLNTVSSYHRTAKKTKFIRLVNYLFRHGKKNKYLIALLKAYTQVLKYMKDEDFTKNMSWRVLFQSLNYMFINPPVLLGDVKHELAWGSGKRLEADAVHNTGDLTRPTILYKNFLRLNMLFSFYIYKVDKHIFKNSRGKSGKFTFV